MPRLYRNVTRNLIRSADLSPLAAFAVLALCQLAGETLVRKLDLIFPGPLAGMLILLGVLVVAGQSPPGLSNVADVLIGHLGMFFLPAATAVVVLWSVMKIEAGALLLSLVVSTLATGLFAGVFAQVLSRIKRTKHERENGADAAPKMP